MHAARLLLFLCLLPLLACCVSANPNGNVSPPRIALVGDSWPLIMRHHQGFKRALVERGYRPRQVRNVAIGWSFLGLTETRLSYPGVESYRFVEERYMRVLDETFARYPTIDIVHLSLGGADILHDMPGDLDPAGQERFIRATILPNIDRVLTRLRATYPDKHIVFVSYDYINFRDTWAEHKRTQGRWERLGQPEPIEMNEMMLTLKKLQQETVAKHPEVVFVDYIGRTKEYAGVPPTMEEPTPREYLWRDGMHLSRDGNKKLAEYCLDQVYEPWLFPLRDVRGQVVLPERELRQDSTPDALAKNRLSP